MEISADKWDSDNGMATLLAKLDGRFLKEETAVIQCFFRILLSNFRHILDVTRNCNL